MEKRKCITCKRSLPLDSRSDKVYCTECKMKGRKQPVKRKEFCQQCNKKLPIGGRSDKMFCNDLCRNNYNNYAGNNYIKRLYQVTKKRAIKNNIPFTIKMSELIVPEVCPVFGIPLFRRKGSMCNNSPSIDKIINERGYVKGNVWIISMRANRVKNSLTKDELITFCTKILAKIQSIDK